MFSLRGLRWLTGGEVFFYAALIVANIMYVTQFLTFIFEL